jgi:hypothetical protein
MRRRTFFQQSLALFVAGPPGPLAPAPAAPVRDAASASLPPELARRVQAFCRQIVDWVEAGRPGVPLLALPGGFESGVGRCVSCGEPASPGRWRCPLCYQAVALAIGFTVARE